MISKSLQLLAISLSICHQIVVQLLWLPGGLLRFQYFALEILELVESRMVPVGLLIDVHLYFGLLRGQIVARREALRVHLQF